MDSAVVALKSDHNSDAEIHTMLKLQGCDWARSDITNYYFMDEAGIYNDSVMPRSYARIGGPYLRYDQSQLDLETLSL